MSAISLNSRVFVNKQPVLTQPDTFTVAGCPFVVGSFPRPCILVKWVVPSSRIKVDGKSVLLKDSMGLCESADQTPQGSPNVLSAQFKVKGQ